MYLERQYLEGHPALFPDAIEDGARLRERAERLVELGDSLAPLIDGQPPARRRRKLGPEAIRAAARSQAPVLAARLVEAARLATIDVLGDGAAARTMAARRFRAGIEAEA